MVGGLAAGEVSTFQLTAGQNHYQVACIVEEEAEDEKVVMMRTVNRRGVSVTCWNMDLTLWTGCACPPA